MGLCGMSCNVLCYGAPFLSITVFYAMHMCCDVVSHATLAYICDGSCKYVITFVSMQCDNCHNQTIVSLVPSPLLATIFEEVGLGTCSDCMKVSALRENGVNSGVEKKGKELSGSGHFSWILKPFCMLPTVV